jgi:hypothetical protein
MVMDRIPTCKMTDRHQRHLLTGPEMMYVSRPLLSWRQCCLHCKIRWPRQVLCTWFTTAMDRIPTCNMTDRHQRHLLTGPEMTYVSIPLKHGTFLGAMFVYIVK